MSGHQEPAPDTSRYSPRLLFSLAVLVLVVLLELASYAVIGVSGRVFDEPIRRKAAVYREQRAGIERLLADSTMLVQLDGTLGWRYRGGYASGRDTVSAQGVRATRTYAAAPPDSVLRAAAFGDSFVYCNEVGNPDCWTAVVEARDPRVEVLNFGVGGYGDDQAYLRMLQEGTRFKPRVAILGFATDDLRRTVNVYRRFISTYESPVTKPRFVLDSSAALRLIPNPLADTSAYRRLARRPSGIRDFGRFDQWYQPAMYDNPLYDWSATVRVASFVGARLYRRYLDPQRLWAGQAMNTASNAFRLQSAIFSAFARSADSLDMMPVILFLPDRNSVGRALGGQATLYASLANEARARHLAVLDASDAFRADPDRRVDSWFAAGGHYSPVGNRIVGTWLAGALRQYASPTGRAPGR